MYTQNGTIQDVKYTVTPSPDNRLKVYHSLVMHLVGVASCIYVLATGDKPPKLKEILR